jgi:hypothetical protein
VSEAGLNIALGCCLVDLLRAYEDYHSYAVRAGTARLGHSNNPRARAASRGGLVVLNTTDKNLYRPGAFGGVMDTAEPIMKAAMAQQAVGSGTKM